ncbi:hypothetical protein C3L33_10876, partial [Rhododendron williamsianum]
MEKNQPPYQDSPPKPPSLLDYYGLIDDNCPSENDSSVRTLELEDALSHLGLYSPPSHCQRPLTPPGFSGQKRSDRGNAPIDNSNGDKDLRGQIFYLSKNAYGSHLLKKLIMKDPKEDEIEMVLSDMINHVSKLMRDRYGNYVIQEIFKVCNEKQRTRIIASLTQTRSQFIKICHNQYGARAVLVLLDHISSQQQISLFMSALSPGAAALANDPNAWRDYLALSRKKFSSRVVERCLRKAGEEQASWIILELLTSPNICALLVDPFGNFVIQTALEVSQVCSTLNHTGYREVKDYSLIMKGSVLKVNYLRVVNSTPLNTKDYSAKRKAAFRHNGKQICKNLIIQHELMPR